MKHIFLHGREQTKLTKQKKKHTKAFNQFLTALEINICMFSVNPTRHKEILETKKNKNMCEPTKILYDFLEAGF